MRLILDEMYPPVVAEQLRSRGHDVIAVKEEESLIGLSDAALFAFAIVECRALVTENFRHFQVLHMRYQGTSDSHPGLVYTTERAFFRGHPRAVGRLVRALDALLTSDEEIEGQELWLREA